MKLKNIEILNYASMLANVFNEQNDKYIPIKIGFAIQKNLSTLFELTREIETSREKICREYGRIEEGQEFYTIDEDKIDIANKEIKDLYDFEQEVNIRFVKLSNIENLEFTISQINALMFMIEEE